MGNLNEGYGSELHLLRWLGLHRDDLTRKVEDKTGLSGLQWMQFGFSQGEKKYDSELRKLNFLSPSDREVALDRYFGKINPNWDAVATGMRNGNKCYVLVEAKAHTEEIADGSSHGGESHDAIAEELKVAAKAITGIDDLGEDWIGKYYQLANRLYVQKVLEGAGIDSIQVNIYFCGDRHDGKNCPADKSGWQAAVRDELKFLKLETDAAKSFLDKHYRELYIDVCSNRDMDIA